MLSSRALERAHQIHSCADRAALPDPIGLVALCRRRQAGAGLAELEAAIDVPGHLRGVAQRAWRSSVARAIVGLVGDDTPEHLEHRAALDLAEAAAYTTTEPGHIQIAVRHHPALYARARHVARRALALLEAT